MTSCRCVVAVLVLAGALPVPAQEPTTTTAPTSTSAPAGLTPQQTQEIRGLIKQLSSDSFRQRQDAKSRLSRYGLEAWTEIRQGLLDDDAEVQAACGALLASLEKELDALMSQATAAMNEKRYPQAEASLLRISRATGSRFVPLAQFHLAMVYDFRGQRPQRQQALRDSLNAKVEFEGRERFSWFGRGSTQDELRARVTLALLQDHAQFREWDTLAKFEIPDNSYLAEQCSPYVALGLYRLGKFKEAYEILEPYAFGTSSISPTFQHLVLRLSQKLGTDTEYTERVEQGRARFYPQLKIDTKLQMEIGSAYDVGNPEPAFKGYIQPSLQGYSYLGGTSAYVELLCDEEPRVAVPYLMKQLDGPDWVPASILLARIGVLEAKDKILARAKEGKFDRTQARGLGVALAIFASDDAIKLLEEKVGGDDARIISDQYPRGRWAAITKMRHEAWLELSKKPWKPTPRPTTTSSPATKPAKPATPAPGAEEVMGADLPVQIEAQ